jgi:hypothetical protein
MGFKMKKNPRGFGHFCTLWCSLLVGLACAATPTAISPASAQYPKPFSECPNREGDFLVADICFSVESKYSNLRLMSPASADAHTASANTHIAIENLKKDLTSNDFPSLRPAETPSGVSLKISAQDIATGGGFAHVLASIRSVASKSDMEVSRGPDDFIIHAFFDGDPSRHRQILAHLKNGDDFDLAKNPWLYSSDERTMVGVTVTELAKDGKCSMPSNALRKPHDPEVVNALPVGSNSAACSYSFVLFRPQENPSPSLQLARVFPAFVQVPELIGPDSPESLSPVGLAVTNDLWRFIDDISPGDPAARRFTLNDMALRRVPRQCPENDAACADFPPAFIIPPATDGWRVEVLPQDTEQCRAFPSTGKATFVDIPRPAPILNLARANGIMVGAVKIFDVLALRKMLNDTASQLSSLGGFNQAAISGALTNLQGLSRDTSFLNAQLATVPTNSIATTNTAGNGGSFQSVQTIPNGSSTTSGTVTLQCPDGTVPNITSGGAQGCLATSGADASKVTTTTSGTSTAANTTQNTNGNNNSQQTSTVTTNPSVSGQSFVPAVAPATAFTAPTNLGLSSADILTDQVNLNAQITTLRMLLQGALSDQYLVKNGRAVASRQQTTVGFNVSIDPPRQYKYAVAEVRVIVSAPPGAEPVSIMNLLPSEKTYNVAKVTSSEKSFGVGVVKAPIGLGINGGRARDRLYLAKDTDTIALEFPAPDSRGIGSPFPVQVGDVTKSAIHFDRREEGCEDDTTASLPVLGQLQEGETSSVVFGWQFRPVLGETYVKGGQRQVFAQLALPTSQNQRYVPRVHIQTRWRAYDPKRQVVGATYKRTCSWSEDQSGVVVLTNPSVTDVKVSDIGGGQVRLVGQGEFFSSGSTIVAGTSTYAPTAFDGRSIQFIGKASDLMLSDELTIVGPTGQHSTFGVPVAEGKADHCNIFEARATALPFPDGNSRVTVQVKLGRDYQYDPTKPAAISDGKPNPFVMIGTQVYGMRETPYGPNLVFVPDAKPDSAKTSGHLDEQTPGSCSRESNFTKCTYGFIAPTTDIRNAQSFLVRDIAWNDMRYSGPIHFFPSVTTLSRISVGKPDSGTAPPKPAPKAPAPASSTVATSKEAPPSAPASAASAAAPTGSPVATTPTPPAHGNASAPPGPPGPPAGNSGKEGPVDFSVKGYDLQKAMACKNSAAAKSTKLAIDPTWLSAALPAQTGSDLQTDEALCVYVAGGDFEWHVISPTLAILRVSSQLAKSPVLRLELMSAMHPNDWTRHVAWEIPIPKEAQDSNGITAVQLHRGDAGLVTFKGTSFTATPTVTFDGVALEIQTDPTNKTQLGVLIPSSLTKTGGHKELKATVPGSSKVTMLPIDVLN